MNKEPNRTIPGELANFAYEFVEAGKPTNTAFEGELMDGNIAISRAHRIRTWKRQEVARFQTDEIGKIIDMEQANKHFNALLRMDWQEVDNLMLRVVPHPNKPAQQRRIIFYLPTISDFTMKRDTTSNAE